MIDLFPFQVEDVEKLRDQSNVAIFSEMGTGKTFEAIALDTIRRVQASRQHKQEGPTLVVAPLSTLSMWAEHFERLTNLTTRVVDPKDRSKFLAEEADVYILHWDVLRLIPELAEIFWLHIIADEAQKICNRKNKWTKALKKLRASFKTALTGTPVMNRPDDLWSILNWLYPKDRNFSSYWRFFKTYVDATQHPYHKYWEIHGPKNSKRLQALVSPFTVRRKKKDVLPDLPDKYFTRIEVELSDTQRRIYEQMREEMLAWVGEHEDKPLVAPVTIAKLVRLQQIALATPDITFMSDGSIEITLDEPSSKLDALMDIVEGTDQKIVVFTQFTKMTDLVERRLQRAKVQYVRLTGQDKPDERESSVRMFQQDNQIRVFVGSIGAGGVGITLTSASIVVFLDRAWSPAVNSQAEDRLHRIGQKDAVQVIDIVARDSVDQGRFQRLDLKASWIRQILDGKRTDVDQQSPIVESARR